MVDPSLLRQANDRGVTIAFADLDGADGLWVPEERTVLVSRKLTEAEVARVIEHELTHVMIDDQHADLDAGKDVVVGHPPVRSRRWAAAGLTAAGVVAVAGGLVFGIAKATGGPPKEQLAPTLPGLTASESGSAPPGMVVVPSRRPDGQIVYVTVSASAPAAPTAAPTATPIGSVSLSPSAKPVPPNKPTATPSKGPVTLSPSPPPPTNPTVVPTVDPTVDPTTPEPPPTTPAGASLPPGGDQSGAGTPADSADEPGPVDASDVVVAGRTGADPGVEPYG